MEDIDSKVVSYTVKGDFAVITLDNPKQLNALTMRQFYRLATIMQEIDGLDHVLVTVLTGKGRFFSAGANLRSQQKPTESDPQLHYLHNFVANNLFLTEAFSTHSKILVAALNGPAVGGAAAVAAFADFVYAAPHTYLLTPFASLGLVAEVGTSHTLVKKLGVSLANEAMLMGRKIVATELLRCNFVNKIFETGDSEDEKFLALVMQELEESFGDDLNRESLLKIKALLRKPERDALTLQNVAEVFAGWKRLTSGVVDKQIARLQFGQKRNKL